jgi:rod shape-determining protein MreC
MAVITADGIVGKVLVVYSSVSQVLLINDQSSGVGALLEKTRLQGVLRGTANGEVVLERVMSDEQVPLGETVLTSGGDQIFPKGLPIGSVMKVGNGKDLFLNIKIKPAANLSKLEEVLVLVENKERQAVAEENVHVRAADILAQRLPSVPDKPATSANAAAGTAGTTANPAAAKTAAKPGSTTPATPAPKKPSTSSNVSSASAPGTGQAAKPAAKPADQTSPQTSPAPKNAGAASDTEATPKPDASEKPASDQPKTAEPSPAAAPTPPPADAKPPGDQSSPQ